MSTKKKQSRKSRALVLGYLERVSSKIFSDFPQELTDLVGRSHGVYALYKGKRLYYVGLASNLRGRLKQHLRDKHAGKWDKFSVYLVRKADHIKELETLIMRVANPAGNTATGRLPRAENFKADLLKRIKEKQEHQLYALIGARVHGRKKKGIRGRKTVDKKYTGHPTLSPYIKSGFRIRGEYKGQTYRAIVNRSGSIRYNGQLYNSPSMAGKAARGRNTNGWTFWKFKNAEGEWITLDQLRSARK